MLGVFIVIYFCIGFILASVYIRYYKKDTFLNNQKYLSEIHSKEKSLCFWTLFLIWPGVIIVAIIQKILKLVNIYLDIITKNKG